MKILGEHSFTLPCCHIQSCFFAHKLRFPSAEDLWLMSQRVGGYQDLSASHVLSSSVKGSPTALTDQHSTGPGPN